jgi:hypothetical protein
MSDRYIYIGEGGNNYVIATYWETVSAASGSITVKAGGTVKLDSFQGLEDAVVSATSGGLPTFSAAVNGSGTRVSTTFDSSGNYSLSGTPSSYPVAIVYRVAILESDIDWNADNLVVEDVERDSVAWGAITGSISSQVDLQSELNLKANLASPTFTGTVSGITSTMVGLGNVDNTSDANKSISIAGYSANSTGVKTGGVLSIGTGGAGVATSFTIALGAGMIVDNTVIPATLSQISWSAKTDVEVTNIGTQPLTFVAIDSGGNVIQQATDFTDAQHRQYIVIGSVIHTNSTTVTAVNQAQHLAISPQSQLNDLMQGIGGFNYSGNVFSANGANLNINKSAGVIFKQGSNYATSANSPNSTTTGSLTAASFRYNNQTGNASGLLTAIDPNNYDLAGVTTSVPSNRFTIQRIFIFSSNLLAIQRGQSIYGSLAEAKAAIQTESFIVNSSISPNGILRAFLIVRQGTTALNSATNAFFLEAPKFGGTAGVGGLSVSTLQNAYDNSISPEIQTDATRGAVTIQRGSGSDTDNILEGLNGSGTTTFTIKGNGGIAASGTITFSGIPTSNPAVAGQLWNDGGTLKISAG